MTIKLLAMTRYGETFFVRDAGGTVWLRRPAGVGGERIADPAEVEWAVAKHDFERVDRSFESWEALDEFRLARVREALPETIVDVDAFDLADVERMLGIARRWATSGEGPLAQRLTLRLLEVPAVLADPETHHRLVGFLGELAEPPAPEHDGAPTLMQRRARERWAAEMLPAAA